MVRPSVIQQQLMLSARDIIKRKLDKSDDHPVFTAKELGVLNAGLSKEQIRRAISNMINYQHIVALRPGLYTFREYLPVIDRDVCLLRYTAKSRLLEARKAFKATHGYDPYER